MSILNLKDERYGRLLVLEFAGKTKGRRYWQCLCDCGNTTRVLGAHLRCGNTTSCGCYHADRAKTGSTTHGMRYTQEYALWCNLRKRFGVTVCDTWKTSFEAFFRDTGKKPSEEHRLISVDGINFNKHTSFWMTRQERHDVEEKTNRKAS